MEVKDELKMWLPPLQCLSCVFSSQCLSPRLSREEGKCWLPWFAEGQRHKSSKHLCSGVSHLSKTLQVCPQGISPEAFLKGQGTKVELLPLRSLHPTPLTTLVGLEHSTRPAPPHLLPSSAQILQTWPGLLCFWPSWHHQRHHRHRVCPKHFHPQPGLQGGCWMCSMSNKTAVQGRGRHKTKLCPTPRS